MDFNSTSAVHRLAFMSSHPIIITYSTSPMKPNMMSQSHMYLKKRCFLYSSGLTCAFLYHLGRMVKCWMREMCCKAIDVHRAITLSRDRVSLGPLYAQIKLRTYFSFRQPESVHFV